MTFKLSEDYHSPYMENSGMVSPLFDEKKDKKEFLRGFPYTSI